MSATRAQRLSHKIVERFGLYPIEAVRPDWSLWDQGNPLGFPEESLIPIIERMFEEATTLGAEDPLSFFADDLCDIANILGVSNPRLDVRTQGDVNDVLLVSVKHPYIEKLESMVISELLSQ